MMFKVQKNRLKIAKEEYLFLKNLCRKSKDLYNQTLYQTRQHFFNCGEFLNSNKAYDVLKTKECYKLMPSDPAQQTMKIVERDFRSFFGLLQKKKAGNYNRKANLPRYKNKDGYSLLIFPIRKHQNKEYFVLSVPKDMQEQVGFKKFKYPISKNVIGKEIKEVRILPKNNAKFFEIEFVYQVEGEKHDLNQDHTLAIDVGVTNFATCLDMESGFSFILDGKEIKSLNRFFNKTKAHLQSILDHQKKKWSRRLSNLSYRRDRQLNEYMNQYCNLIVQYCLLNKVGHICVGEGWTAQDGCNLGRRNNQNFTQIPFGKFVQKLKAKCEYYGILFETIQEAYTSKCDHLANEPMCHQEKYLGKRIKRGLFKSSTGVILNADVNGALGIGIKSTGNRDLISKLNSGVVTTPCRIRIGAIHQSSAKGLLNQTKPLVQFERSLRSEKLTRGY